MAKLDFWKTVVGQGEKIPWPLPRLTSAERDQLQTSSGLMIYNTDLNTVQVFNDQVWVTYGDTAGQVVVGWTRINVNFAALSGSKYIIDTTSAALTMTLPTNPQVGAEIKFVDGAGTFPVRAVTVIRNGKPISGANQNLILDSSVSGGLLYMGGSEGWRVTFNNASTKPLLKVASFVATAGNEYDCDTTAGIFTGTLPGAPSEQDRITFNDFAKTWGTNNFTIAGNGKLIVGLGNLICNISARLTLIYSHGAWTL